MRILILLAFLCSLSACGPDYFFQEEKEISQGRWAYADTLDFAFDIRDTASLYNLYVQFEYADTFPNQNIYINFHTRFPSGKRLSKPLSFDFFDPVGKPAGECSGQTCKAQIAIQQKAFFETPGQYIITLEQFGRQDSLPGITQVGLAIEKTGKK